MGGFSGDGGPATHAGTGMQNRTGLALDPAGNLYVADGFNHRVRVIAPNGIINTFAGNGQSTTAGDGGLAQNAGFSIPRGTVVRRSGRSVYLRRGGKSHPGGSGQGSHHHRGSEPDEFFAQAGGLQTPPQQLTVDGPVSGVAFTISASSGADWLLASAGGLTPGVIDVKSIRLI